MSITTSLLNACRYSKASRATRTTASGSSPLTWKIGAWIMRATSVRVERRARVFRGGGEADLVVDHHVHGAAGAVAAQLRQVERLGDHALAGEGGVAVDRERQHGVALQPTVDPVLLGPDDALEHRVDRLQVRRVRHHRDLDRVLVVGGGELAVHAQVVLHVAGALRRSSGRGGPRTR